MNQPSFNRCLLSTDTTADEQTSVPNSSNGLRFKKRLKNGHLESKKTGKNSTLGEKNGHVYFFVVCFNVGGLLLFVLSIYCLTLTFKPFKIIKITKKRT